MFRSLAEEFTPLLQEFGPVLGHDIHDLPELALSVAPRAHQLTALTLGCLAPRITAVRQIIGRRLFELDVG
jgi:hypothetical protein